MTGSGVVVVGFDGSEDATTALTWAAGAAQAMGTSLCIVHAVGLLEHAGMTGSHVDGAAAVRLAEDAGLGRGQRGVARGRRRSVLGAAPCRRGPDPAVLIVVGSAAVRVATPERFSAARAWSWPSMPPCRSPSCRAGRH